MDSYSPPRESSNQVELSSLVGLYPDEPVKKIAVLFTDLVGSTNYFKTHGDQEGRAMLQDHYEIAAPIINEYGGKLVKALGDSVMASFTNPMEAFKAAIRMQQQFLAYSREKNSKRQMPVRIGVHYGNVIVEEKDIYGDVVNVASKLTNIAEGRHIYISREVYELVKNMPLVHFESINTWDKGNMPKGLTAYKVIWDNQVELSPAIDTILYVKPLWKLCEENFNNTWDDLLEARGALSRGKSRKEEVLPDKSLLIIAKESASAFVIAGNIFRFLRESLSEKGGATFLPVQLIIDIGLFFSENSTNVQDLDYDWDRMNPGSAYISSEAYDMMKRYINIPVLSTPRKLKERVFYKTFPDESEETAETNLFQHRERMVQGKFSPCYYCGDRKHLPLDCPSKALPEVTHALERLGYLSIEEMNEVFLKYLLSEGIVFDMPLYGNEDNSGKSIVTAHNAFFELKRVFQLRFLRAIWDAGGDEWNKIREYKSQSDGGLAWLAQDSLRISDLGRAESILKTALEGNPNNHRIHCILGYLNLERNDPEQAEHYFGRALVHARTDVQKISVLLLLYRLCILNNDYDNARKRLKDILHLSPGCIDAIYHEILLMFREGKEKPALQRLMKLVQENRTYFLYALIDPDLASYGSVIDEQLLTLIGAAKEHAESVLAEAEKELDRAKDLIDVEAVSETQTLMLKIRRLLEARSYFGYLDAAHYGNSLISICKSRVKDRMKKLSERLNQLVGRIEKDVRFVKLYRYPRLIEPHGMQLERVRRDIYQSQDIAKSAIGERVSELESACEKLTAETTRIEFNLKRLEVIEQILVNATKFVKRSAIFISLVVLLGLFAVPTVVNTMGLNVTGPEASASSNVWYYQRTFLAIGIFASLAISLFLTIKNILYDD
jgi:class 3 adenylate cyclase/tetratricopeptide (TPR) repeat protein